ALSEGNLWTYIKSLLAGLPEPVASAHAAALIPVEQVPEAFGTAAIGLFFHALLPVIWLVMVALVYGY
ncbi:hypothetical protein, partial [Escherichia coli]